MRGCQECGSRKAKPREVVPPLRSIRGGDVGDRWALDVAGPLPVAGGGQRYVIAAVDYVTRYAVAKAVKHHTAENVAKFIMDEVVLKFGVFRELLTDGAPELAGRVIEQLVMLLQAQQINPVPYRPQMIGLVERFHRTWKDCVATYMKTDAQNDRAEWISFAVYAYNSGHHSTVALSPNELMMGRMLRSPNELLQRAQVTEAGDLAGYHRQLLVALKRSHVAAERARVREQLRQARYYNRNVRNRRELAPGDRVWMYRPPRGPKSTKFVHQCAGPMKIIEPAGFENFLIEREDQDGEAERFIAHVSFLISYHYPVDLLKRAANDIVEQLGDEDQEDHRPEDQGGRDVNVETAGASAGATTAHVHAATAAGSRKRKARGAEDEMELRESSGPLVEVRRRKRRNSAGYYVLEYALRPLQKGRCSLSDGDNVWVSSGVYDELFAAGRVVEDSALEEGV